MKMIKLLIAASILSGCPFALAQSPSANQTAILIPFDLSTQFLYSDIFSFDKTIEKDSNGNRRIEVTKANKIIAPALNLKLSQASQYLSNKEMTTYDSKLRNLLLNEVINGVFMQSSDIGTHFIKAQNGKGYTVLSDYFVDLSKNNPIMLYFVQEKNPSRPAYTKAGIKNFKRDLWSKNLIYTAITTEIKQRKCFQRNPDEESIKTTMAHEMGHVFLIHGWPDLRTNDFLPAYVAHEAFAVYTEYLYLKNNKNIQPFDIIDFIRDSAEDKGVYSVDPDYMLCFLKGLDYEKLNFDNPQDLNVEHIPFNYDFLSQASDLCKKLKYKQNINDGEYKYQLGITYYRSDAAQQQTIKEEVSATIDFRLFVEPFNKESEKYVINTLRSNPKLSSLPSQKYSWRTGFESLIKRKIGRKYIVRKCLIQNVLNELTNNQLKKNIDIYSVDWMIP